MTDFGDIRSACHARDLRALLEASYRKRRYVLYEVHERYINDELPEHEREVWVWMRAMMDHLLEVTNVPHAMLRAFVATWGEWAQAGAKGFPPEHLVSHHYTVYLGWRMTPLLRALARGLGANPYGLCDGAHEHMHEMGPIYPGHKKSKDWEVEPWKP